ncbi:hypothetical protein POUND7_000955 [Theobroma cacao]
MSPILKRRKVVPHTPSSIKTMLLCFCETLKLMFVRTSIGSDGRMVNTTHYVMVPGKYFPSQR